MEENKERMCMGERQAEREEKQGHILRKKK